VVSLWRIVPDFFSRLFRRPQAGESLERPLPDHLVFRSSKTRRPSRDNRARARPASPERAPSDEERTFFQPASNEDGVLAARSVAEGSMAEGFVAEGSVAEGRTLFQPFNGFLSPDASFSGAVATPQELGASDGDAAQAGQKSLGSRAVKSAGWTLAGTVWAQFLGVARTVVLAHLLSKGDFGLTAMALTVSVALYTLTNTGVVASVVAGHFDDEDELHRYANLVWSMELGRGLVIAALMMLGAAPFAHFYGEPRLLPILLVLALEPLFPVNIGLFLQSRSVEMKRMTLSGLYSNTLSVGATLALAWWLRSYWALVWGQIIGSLATTIFSFIFSSYRPRLSWNSVLARRAFHFGKFQFVIGLCNFALTTMDNMLVGFFYKAEVLGVYALAYSFCTMARSLVNNTFSTVLFPAFAAAGREEDPSRLRSLVERAFALGAVVMTVFLVPLLVYAPAVVRILFAKWGMAPVEPMRWLLVAGWFAGLLSLFSSFFVGLDRPKIESNAKLLDAAVFLAILVPLTRFNGAVGAAQAGAIAWALACTWRLKWANTLAPGAFNRLPFLVVSSALVGGLGVFAGLVPWSLRGGFSLGSWQRAFHPAPLSLGTAWTQMLVGAPLVAAVCAGGLVLLHPMARAELQGLGAKLFARFGARRGKRV